MTYGLLNKLMVKPDKRQRMVEILLESGQLFRRQPGVPFVSRGRIDGRSQSGVDR
jgi:hypothetical protein